MAFLHPRLAPKKRARTWATCGRKPGPLADYRCSRIWSRQAQAAAIGAHFVLLVGANAKVGARPAGTQQNKPSFPVLRVISIGIRLIHFARAFQAAGAGEASSLVAKRGQDDAGGLGGVPNVLFRFDNNGALAPRRQQGDTEGFASFLRRGFVHTFILKEGNVPARPGRARPDRNEANYEPM